MIVTLIAAVSRNGVIGREGTLPWRLPDDLARFKRITVGKPIVMGRKTYESIGRPLPKRMNIVLSRTASAIDGCIVVPSPEEAMLAAADAAELCVIGGETVNAVFLPRADRLELTEVLADVDGDARFPDLDRSAWRIASAELHDADERHAHAFRFVTYERSGSPNG